MKKINITKNLKKDASGIKIGQIQLNPISKNLSSNELKVYLIKFEKGAKSKLHLHDSDQIIIGHAGKGELITYSKMDLINESNAKLKKEKMIEIVENEAVLIPAGKLHWHRGHKNQSFSYISIMSNGKTFWL